MAEEKQQEAKPGLTTRMLGTVERVGNALPDPAVLFIALLFIVWILSWLMSYITFDVFHPATKERIVIVNQLSGDNFVAFLATMVNRSGPRVGGIVSEGSGQVNGRGPEGRGGPWGSGVSSTCSCSAEGGEGKRLWRAEAYSAT